MGITQTVHETSFGPMTLAASADGLTKVRFGADQPVAGPATAILDRARRELDEYLAGERNRFTVPVDLARVRGEHRTILDALDGVGFGETRTYGELAMSLGLTEDGPRRVGAAMARNPVLVVVPCHRVLGVDGRLVGYAGGTGTKRALLELESRDRAGQTVLC